MIDEIELNFRHLRNLALRELAPVNIIVGPNNAGKTSILRGVQKLAQREAYAKPDNHGHYLKIGKYINIRQGLWDEFPEATRLFLDPSRNTTPELRSLTKWMHFSKMHARLMYIAHNSNPEDPTARALTFSGATTYASKVADVVYGNPSWHTMHDLLNTNAITHINELAQESQNSLDSWINQTYFLWHRRKSRYSEELGAYHDRLDEEAEHLAGRLDHLFTQTNGGSVRDHINAFLEAVVPGVGDVSIRRNRPEQGSRTTISVVFSTSDGERTLEDLGGGVEQVLALAIVLIGEKDDGAVFVEEPESHLHESAQRRLIEQIRDHRGSRQIFITTHSPVFVNEFSGANIYRVTRCVSGNAEIHPCVGKASQRQILNDLGVLPSSLTQTNCVVWVEGPTETRLVRYWLTLVAPDLRVHQHYEFAETGGSNLAYFAADLPTGNPGDLRDVMRICLNNFIICDKDAGIGAEPSKSPVSRIEELGVEHWITRGYEIEWYFPQSIIGEIWGEGTAAHMAACQAQDQPFYKRLASSGGKTVSAEKRKVHFAERIVKKAYPEDVWFAGEAGQELQSQVRRLAEYIRKANQMTQPIVTACKHCGQTPSAVERQTSNRMLQRPQHSQPQ